MAKSLRSKWKRKMKQEKRVRYGKKELEHLKSVVEKAKENDALAASEVTMAESDLYTVVTEPSARRGRPRGGAPPAGEGTQKMEVETPKIARIFNQVTLKDQFGNFPVWVSSHRKKKSKIVAKITGKIKKKTEKKLNKKRKNY